MTSAQEPGSNRGPLERVLGLFAEVRRGEAVTVLLLTLNVFLLLASYYVIKTLRESEILSRGMLGLGGAELKAYATAGQAFLFLLIVPAYASLAGKVNRIKLINITTMVFMACLAAFFVLAGVFKLAIGLAYFLWVGIFSMMVIAQFWSFANDLYSPGQGKRLFPIVAVGGSLGAMVGGPIASLAKQFPYELMLAAAGVLGVCLLLYNTVHRREVRRIGQAGATETSDAEKPIADESKSGGFRLVFKNRYLLLIAFMLFFSNFVNSTGEYLLSDRVSAYAHSEVPDTAFPELEGFERETAIGKARGAVIGDFYGKFFGVVNLLALLIQAFLVSRIFKFLGVRVALFFLPLVALTGNLLLVVLLPSLAVIRIAKIGENSTDYSLQNTVRQALFLPTSRAAKYKAKAAIDTFFVRFGDASSALLVFLGIHILSFTARSYAVVNLVVLVIVLAIVFFIAKRHKQLTVENSESS